MGLTPIRLRLFDHGSSCRILADLASQVVPTGFATTDRPSGAGERESGFMKLTPFA